MIECKLLIEQLIKIMVCSQMSLKKYTFIYYYIN